MVSMTVVNKFKDIASRSNEIMKNNPQVLDVVSRSISSKSGKYVIMSLEELMDIAKIAQN